ncbi:MULTISPECIES: M15 family metallopeptidase [Caproicibacterium]|nr:M15 family metallopeptidase [Caproicibacterium lactatifermentans]
MRKSRQEQILDEDSPRGSVAGVRHLKNWMRVVLAAILVLAVLLGVLVWKYYMPKTNGQSSSAGSAAALAAQSTEVLSEPDDSWALTVVSQDRKISSSFSPQLVSFGNVQVDQRIVPSLQKMLDDAKAAGYTLSVKQGYVDAKMQESQYQAKIKTLMQQGKTCAIAESDAAALVPPGGCSENQTGMAVTFPSDQTFLSSDGYHWLLNHCVEYGFVRHYTDSKEGRTGLKDDPSHFRYVGTRNAKNMRRLGLCLEEYAVYVERQSSGS